MEPKLELVQNWLIKANRDLGSARKLAGGPDPYLDVAIYLCQQAAEKAVKGLLVFHDQPFKKTHDIGALVALATKHEPSISDWQDAATRLTPYATEFRYPGGVLQPSVDEFGQALSEAEGLYSPVLSALPADVGRYGTKPARSSAGGQDLAGFLCQGHRVRGRQTSEPRRQSLWSKTC